MIAPGRRLVALVPVVLLAASLALEGRQPFDALLKESDVGAFAPDSFRAVLALTRNDDERSRIEIWRSGADRTLIRFLDEKERGKFLLRRDQDLWLLTPTARDPVRLSPSHRVYGAATVDVLFTLRLADEYRIEDAQELSTEEGRALVFELEARDETAQFATIRYTVNPDTRRPISARYRLQSGREATLIEFKAWSADRRHARTVVVTDLLRKGRPTRIDVREFEERPVPDGLFDLKDPSARQALAPPSSRKR